MRESFSLSFRLSDTGLLLDSKDVGYISDLIGGPCAFTGYYATSNLPWALTKVATLELHL